MKKKQKGFTLIELLVVIAIIGLLASTVLASLDSVRKKARDTKRIADFEAVSLAMQLYYDEHGEYPPSPNNCCSGGSGGSHYNNFRSMVQHLVDEGYLADIPEDPKGGGYAYMHYKYSSGSQPGSIIVTVLETIEATTTALYGSCRPFIGNWCSQTSASSYYCICHPY